MNNEKNIDLLNGLIDISRDGVEGFKKCADDAHDSQLKMYFEDRANNCEEAVQTLSAEVRQYGGEPDASGTTKGALHRVWIDIRTALTNKDNLAVLEECERAEDTAVTAYENALKEEMPDSLRTLIVRQLEGARKNHERVRQLRDEARNNPAKA
ncbi:ferritin-like domain-containing protein [Nitrosomonas supralitoralis]|uniref:Aldehyde dehydrogenase n=1 Tax=Nitrosomonas supralitoralis TaxID=2116706 RepID=A0A2P7NR45_9PROT|nr:PA2169 family four-helix-bundle protein [Nitrosomonas supralitoralis]PSJ15899.1 aldehyde dehydrogenase [Nitrosomonas supralitoralis]